MPTRSLTRGEAVMLLCYSNALASDLVHLPWFLSAGNTWHVQCEECYDRLVDGAPLHTAGHTFRTFHPRASRHFSYNQVTAHYSHSLVACIPRIISDKCKRTEVETGGCLCLVWLAWPCQAAVWQCCLLETDGNPWGVALGRGGSAARARQRLAERLATSIQPGHQALLGHPPHLAGIFAAYSRPQCCPRSRTMLTNATMWHHHHYCVITCDRWRERDGDWEGHEAIVA
ncbi:hypothetical protein HaLaN_08038 [Haematococcus lacustris]|uniref:Uncharacterized protein n=1 Tax=Haematococcus lacustris TaxID=44745 RepID=A0A699YY02_HAELA|nr:hypothetical protein HaLaN_08038 [Haematococcus lacustris]